MKKKYIYIMILLLHFVTSLQAAEDVKLACDTQLQATTSDALWKCPELDEHTQASLSDMDLVTGNFVCSYNYKNTGRFATSCTYTSSKYKEQLQDRLDALDAKIAAYDDIDFATDANMITGITGVPDAIGNIQDLTNDMIDKLQDFSDDAQSHSGDGISGVDSEIAAMQQTIYDHLQKPYVSNDAGLVKKGDTFSRFIVGLMTLDPDVVKGYDERTGQLMISSDWETKASEISSQEQGLIDKIKSYLPWTDDNPMVGLGDIMQGKGTEGNDLDNDVYNVASWIDIFKMKIWGYFYNLNRKLDIAFDKVSTSLLFFFLIFTAAGLALKKGTKFALRRRRSPELGENFSLDEKGTMNLLTVIGAFLIFFVSIPAGISSTNVVTDSAEVPNEFKMNNSIFKSYVRYVAKQGTYYADMASDLGTAAFLDYMVKKQGLYTGNDIKTLFDSDVRQMAYYYPSLQVAQECEMYYGQDFNTFISNTKDSAQISIQPNYNQTAPFFTKNGIGGIDWNLCKNVHKNLILVPANIASSAATTEFRLDNVSKVRATATRFIVQNHVLLQDKLGWFNVVSIPFSYMLMSKMDLFFESGLDYDAIDEKTKQYVANVGLKDGGDIQMDDSGFFEWIDTTSGKLRNDIVKGGAFSTHIVTQFAFYNFLPGFENIKRSLREMKKNLLGDSSERNTGQEKLFFKNLPAKFIPAGLLKHAGTLATEALIHLASMAIWQQTFYIIMFVMIILIMTYRMLIKLLHLSLFIFLAPLAVLWGFAGGKDVGMRKFKQFALEALLASFSIIIFVLAAFLVPFFMEAFSTLSAMITSAQVEQHMHLVNLAITGSNEWKQAAFVSYLTLYSVKDALDLLIPVASLWFSYFLIFKLEGMVKRILGIRDDAANDRDLEDLTNQTQNKLPYS